MVICKDEFTYFEAPSTYSKLHNFVKNDEPINDQCSLQ